MRCYGNTARHDFVTGDDTPGPNVFFDGRAEQSYAEVGPHQRWATGALFDNIVHRSVSGTQIIGAYIVFYNCLGDTHQVSSPPYAHNWSIGGRAKTRQGTGRPVEPVPATASGAARCDRVDEHRLLTRSRQGSPSCIR
jgi:hypothetical protein